MICFEIQIDKTKKYTIGSDEAEEFGVSLAISPQLNPPHVSADLCGFILNEQKYPHELRWGSEKLDVGTEIKIKVIESSIPDPPQLVKYNEGAINKYDQDGTMLCSNCGKSHFETNKMIRGSRVTLCEECLKLMAAFLKHDEM